MTLKDMVEALKGRYEMIAMDNERAAKELKALQEKIKDGESTGSGFQDFCILHLGKFEDEHLSRVEKEARENLQGLVLTVETKSNITGCPGVLPPREIPRENISTDEYYVLGKLKENPVWNVLEGKLILPTERYLNNFNNRGWHETTGNMELTLGNLFHDRTYSSMHMLFGGVPLRHEFAFYFGNEAEEKLRSEFYKISEICEQAGFTPRRNSR